MKEDAVKGSMALLRRQLRLAREQRDQALEDARIAKSNYTNLADAANVADWTCRAAATRVRCPGSAASA